MQPPSGARDHLREQAITVASIFLAADPAHLGYADALVGLVLAGYDVTEPATGPDLLATMELRTEAVLQADGVAYLVPDVVDLLITREAGIHYLHAEEWLAAA